ncbi:hypothetical protein ES703_115794 [subsurface metagenome]
MSTLDGLGEHRELLNTLQGNIAAIGTRLDSFQRSLTPSVYLPSVDTIKHWQECPDCSPIYADRRFALVDLMVADLSDDERESLWKRLHDEKLAALTALGKYSEEQPPEQSREAVLAQSEHSDENVPDQSGELRRAWLVMAPGGGHHGFKWDSDRSYYCLLVSDEDVANEWRKKSGIKVVELAGTVLDEYEQSHPPSRSDIPGVG